MLSNCLSVGPRHQPLILVAFKTTYIDSDSVLLICRCVRRSTLSASRITPQRSRGPRLAAATPPVSRFFLCFVVLDVHRSMLFSRAFRFSLAGKWRVVSSCASYDSSAARPAARLLQLSQFFLMFRIHSSSHSAQCSHLEGRTGL